MTQWSRIDPVSAPSTLGDFLANVWIVAAGISFRNLSVGPVMGSSINHQQRGRSRECPFRARSGALGAFGRSAGVMEGYFAGKSRIR
jgi:hypothetical protein